MAADQTDTNEFDYTSPVTVSSTPGQRLGVRHQRFRITPDLSITVFENGRVRIGSYSLALNITSLFNTKDGTGLDIRTAPIAAVEAAVEAGGFDERNGPPHEDD
ncbi:hypothetical protein [Modestobacter sp. SYSU DS0657]